VFKRTDWAKYDYSESFWNKIFLNKVWKGYLKLLSGVKLRKGLKILELGSGTGFNSLRLAKEYGASKVILVDFNQEALDSARKRFNDAGVKVKLVKKNVLDFKSTEKFDLVHSQGLIEHFQGSDLQKIINNHLRLTKRKGHIVLFYPTNQGMYSFVRRIAELMNLWIFTDEVPLKKNQVMELTKNVELLKSNKIIPYFLTEQGLLLKKNA